MLKIKCYDKYRKQHLEMHIGTEGDDNIYVDAFSSLHCHAQIPVTFNIVDEGEDPHPERWSDLEGFELSK